jgi:hypothetical protein
MMSTRVLSLRLKENQMARLARLGRRLGMTPIETGACLLEEGLRMADYALITFRNSPGGRQAYVQGTSLAVWEVVLVARSYDHDIARTAMHLHWPPTLVRAALTYARDFPAEIEQAIEDNASFTAEIVARMVPGLEVFTADEGAASQGLVSAP